MMCNPVLHISETWLTPTVQRITLNSKITSFTEIFKKQVKSQSHSSPTTSLQPLNINSPGVKVWSF